VSARVPPAQPPFAPEVAAIIDRVVPAGLPPFALFTTIARDPRLFDRFVGRGYLGKGHLSLRQRELVIARVTAQCGSEYEWGIHIYFFAAEAGFGEPELRSIVHGGSHDPCWSEEDAVLLDLCDALHASCDIDDALWGRLTDRFTPEAVMELLMVAGNYRAVAYMTNALRLPLEDFAARFPSGS
jgi:alkylhydroperoxidase family enzyme